MLAENRSDRFAMKRRPGGIMTVIFNPTRLDKRPPKAKQGR